ncbi:NUDIX hydrolase [Massilia horti]|uniref:NUDIX hydrolase n=1 Tax=Massilia horti TaxID=2562153 RepID=A0A4Y9T492_9BURK|nr:NUDIX hydrolase [Massilia horti]TFW35357.1 NUDIX hydrolase [Massilia horti]
MSRQSTSCGTLVVNSRGQVLLCHTTHTAKWDIPKGEQDPGETPLQGAMRELYEETGLVFAIDRFVDLGPFDYRPAKRLHLFRIDVGDDLPTLDHLACSSFFAHRTTGKPTPEVDSFRWVGREEVRKLCWPRMAGVLESIDW